MCAGAGTPDLGSLNWYPGASILLAHSLARPFEDDTWGTRGQLTKGAVEVQVAGEFESIAIQILRKHSKPAPLQNAAPGVLRNCR